MNFRLKNKHNFFILVIALFVTFASKAQVPPSSQQDSVKVFKREVDTAKVDSVKLKYPFSENQKGSLYLNESRKLEVVYDPDKEQYVFLEKVGNYYIDHPIYMNEDSYKKYRLKKDMLTYFKEKTTSLGDKKDEKARKNLLPKYYVKSEFFENIFGGNEIEVNPQGSVLIKIGGLYQKVENPLISERNRSNFNFDFDQEISASINAKVGKRLRVNANFDTESTFNFQNQVKIEYTPTEDDIIRKIEVGNVSMPLQSSLISGAQNLFGVKTQLQFGRTTITGVFSQQQSQTRSVTAEGGATITEFDVRASNYDDDRHFFLSHYFRDNYNNALSELPLIKSNTYVTRIEVWITNRNAMTEDVRNIVAVADLAEPDVANYTPGSNVSSLSANRLPNNQANTLRDLLTKEGTIRDISNIDAALNPYNLKQGTGYSILENAKKLTLGVDFTLNPELGYITLNRKLADSEVLAVAFEYTVNDASGAASGDNVFRVGELSGDGVTAPSNLVVKLLRNEILNTSLPLWRLMMKNIYSLPGAYQLQQDGFRLEVMYQDDEAGVPLNFLQNAKTVINNDSISRMPLLNLLKLDVLDGTGEEVPSGDGYFDFIEGVTVDSQNGLIMFPRVEPFGDSDTNPFGLDSGELGEILTNSEDDIYVFDELYEEVKAVAQNEYQKKDKYLLKGYFKSDASSGIPLNSFNVTKGSVRVTSNGRELVENVDYVVDYQTGNVQVVNPNLLASNAPIEVTIENNNSFTQQRRRFMGIDVQHIFSDNFAIGGTVVNLNERPFTQKPQFGAEPVNNTIIGANLNYQTEVPKFTKWVNKLPNIDTDVPSNFSVRAEAAYLLPGSPKGIYLNGEATSYVDDFEGSQIPLDISSPRQWFLASVPDFQTDPRLNFKDGTLNPNLNPNLSASLQSGAERSKIAWYTIDRLFYGTQLKPDNIDDLELSRAEVRRVNFEEIFPKQELDITQTNIVNTFDIAYYPNERGSYNYSNVEADGVTYTDNNPEDKWGGIMRALTTTNFQQANIEYIQFWLMDPYEGYSMTPEEGAPANVSPSDFNGDLYFNLGNISEDILDDNRRMYENGLPNNGVKILKGQDDANTERTAWSDIPLKQSLVYAFSENNGDRPNQDIGLDGRNNQEEQEILGLSNLADPSNDDYEFYRSSALDAANAGILKRYKRFNNTEGNSPTIDNSTESYPTSGTSFPDIEDINQDQTMSDIESYYQYKVVLHPDSLVIGKNNIVDVKADVKVKLANGQTITPKWYQFRIPINSGEAINDISGFNSIRFMRMFLTNFKIPVVLRFGELELVRGDWRRYTKYLNPTAPDDQELSSVDNRNFEVGVVNIQENESKSPIPYVLPPGVQRERLQGSTSVQQQNEQSLLIKVNDLEPGETRAVFKNTTFDMRMFNNVKMFVHAANASTNQNSVSNGDLTAILRLGSDPNDNFYQIELPLRITEWGTTSADSIWKNDLNAKLRELGKLKLQRYSDVQNAANTELYPSIASAPNAKIRVKGNPNLSNLRTLMIGVRNDANTAKTAELWYNELRVTDFDNKGGWAAVVNADANFADFADISLSGRAHSQGFGSIDQRVNERSQENVKQYDIVTNVNLGQLLPKKAGIKLPLNYSFSEEFRDPKWDPKYQDVQFEDAKEINENSDYARDYTKRKSINLINVRKERTNTEKKKRFYDVENVTVSYSFNETFHRDYNIELFLDQNVRVGATYNYGFEPKVLEPLKNWKFLNKSRYLKFIKDFNVNLLPTTVSVNSNINRSYNQQKSRSLTPDLPPLPELEQRRFMFDWDYNIAYDLTKSLQFTFRATNNYLYDTFRDINNLNSNDTESITLYSNFFNIGRPSNYHQTLEANYKLPLNKIPIFDFVNATYRYTADFDWSAPARSYISKIGNTIQNANTHSLSADLNMTKFYKRIGLTDLAKKKKRKKKKKKTKETEETERKPRIAKNDERKEKSNKNKYSKLSPSRKILQGFVDVVSSVKKIRASYTEQNGTILPGYEPEVGFLGRQSYNGGLAPTLGFVFGSQSDIRYRAARNQWLLNTNDFSRVYSNTHFQKLDVNANVRPFKDFNIELSANKLYSRDRSQQINIVNNTINDDFPFNEAGNFSISYFMLPTAFDGNGDKTFEKFKNNRSIISQRLGNSTATQYADGYGPNSTQVLIPAFLAAYSGKNANSITTSAFRDIPIPNWNINYKGFMKYKWFKKRFRSFIVEHRYNSTYSIVGYTNNLQRELDLNGNIQPDKLYNGITLVEEFNPLIKVDMKMRNNFSLRAQLKKDKALSLNLNNNTVSEIRGNEYVFGLGYRIRDVKLKIKTGEKVNRFKGDINLKADVSFRNNSTIIRSIDINNNQITGGQRLFSLKLQADYNLSSSLMASFYYDQNSSSFLISNTFPRNSINAGVSLRYTIGN